MKQNKVENRQKIVAKYLENPSSSIRWIASQLHLPVSTVRRTIIKFREEYTIEDKPKSGRPKGPANKSMEKKVVRVLKDKPLLSVRDIAKKAQTSASMVQRVKLRNSYKSYKKQKVPKLSPEQRNRAIRRARALYYQVCVGFDGCMILDDETYVKMDFKTLPGPQYYTKKIGTDVGDEIKAIALDKFGSKLLVWQAICQCGKRSRPYICSGTINSHIYLTECLQKRLLPFIRSHKQPTIFWPDLASSHYANKIIDWLNENNVNFVRKDMNPPNTPQLRPVERYWASVKSILRKDGKTAKTVRQFKAKWISASKKVSDGFVQRLMERVKSKIRAFSRTKMN